MEAKNTIDIHNFNDLNVLLSIYPMEKKEAYQHILPHFQQPGQAYFVTFCLLDSVPRKALVRYTNKLDELKTEIDFRTSHYLIPL